MATSSFNEAVRRIVVSGSINEDSASSFLENITALEYLDSSKLITIYIDTYGGNVDAAMLMYDVMQICMCPIRTIGIGKVMSAGSLILAAGNSNNRFITKNTRVMIHQISGGMRGTISDMDLELKEKSRLQEQYATIMAKHTGKSKKQITEDLKINKYMTAIEAINYGLADKVLSKPIARSRKKKA